MQIFRAQLEVLHVVSESEKKEKAMALLGRFFAVSLDIFWKNIACTKFVDYLLKHTAQ